MAGAGLETQPGVQARRTWLRGTKVKPHVKGERSKKPRVTATLKAAAHTEKRGGTTA